MNEVRPRPKIQGVKTPAVKDQSITQPGESVPRKLRTGLNRAARSEAAGRRI